MNYYLIDQEGFPVFCGPTMELAVGHQTYVTNTTIVTSTEEDGMDKQYVDGVFVDIQENVLSSRRNERREEFSYTLDRMNPAWYSSLTDAQKTSLGAWRQKWLDYPATGNLPTRLSLFN